MKTNWQHIEHARVLHGPGGTPRGVLAGQFVFRTDKAGRGDQTCEVLADNGMTTGWEHVSVKGRSTQKGGSRTFLVNWGVMCAIKEMFWEDWETVVQFHPPKAEYVNCHPHVLHLWRHKLGEPARPPMDLV